MHVYKNMYRCAGIFSTVYTEVWKPLHYVQYTVCIVTLWGFICLFCWCRGAATPFFTHGAYFATGQNQPHVGGGAGEPSDFSLPYVCQTL